MLDRLIERLHHASQGIGDGQADSRHHDRCDRVDDRLRLFAHGCAQGFRYVRGQHPGQALVVLAAQGDRIRKQSTHILGIELDVLDLLPEFLQTRLLWCQKEAAQLGVVAVAGRCHGVRCLRHRVSSVRRAGETLDRGTCVEERRCVPC